MRILISALVALGLCGLSATAQNDPPKPKPQEYKVTIQCYKGNPNGSIEKGDVEKAGSFRVHPITVDGGYSTSNHDPLQKKDIFDKGISFKIEYCTENCLEVEVQTKLNIATKEKPEQDILILKHTKQVQPGGTIRVRMSPESKDNETWAEIKFEPLKPKR